ncbi:MAG: hypothetical protein AB7V55_02980 [Oscillospiraceae bacterium]|jgi:hypothetical protein
MSKNGMMKIVAFMMALGMALALTACSGDSGGTSQPAARPEGMGQNANEVMGLFASATEDTLSIEVIDMAGMMGANRGEGAPDRSGMPEGMEPPDGASFPEGWQPGEGGPPEGMELPDGASFPQGGERPEGFAPGSGFETSGEMREISITDNTTVTVMGDNSSLALDDIEAGEMVRVVLNEDGTSAVSITVMRQTRGEQSE